MTSGLQMHIQVSTHAQFLKIPQENLVWFLVMNIGKSPIISNTVPLLLGALQTKFLKTIFHLWLVEC